MTDTGSTNKPSIFQRIVAGSVSVLALLQLAGFADTYLSAWYDSAMLNYFPELFLDSDNAGTVDLIDNIFWWSIILIMIVLAYWVNDRLLALMTKGDKTKHD